MLALYDVDGAKLGRDRALNLRSLSISVAEMIDSLHRVAAGRQLGKISVTPDAFTVSVVSGWPQALSAEWDKALGLPQDDGSDAVVRHYMEDYMQDYLT